MNIRTSTLHQRSVLQRSSRQHLAGSAIDIGISICIISICIALAARSFHVITAKAQLTEIFTFSSAQRIKLTTEFALTGKSIESSLLHRDSSKTLIDDTSEEKNIEDALSNPTYNSQSSARYKNNRQPQSKPGVIDNAKENLKKSLSDRVQGENKFSYTENDGIIMASGKLDNNKSDFFLTISPSVTDYDVPWNIIWNCGWQKPPNDWISPSGLRGSNLPQDYLFSFCRE